VDTVRTYHMYGVILRRLQNVLWSFLRPLAEHQILLLVSSSDFLLRISDNTSLSASIDILKAVRYI